MLKRYVHFFSLLGKQINRFIATYIQLPVHYTGVKENGNLKIPCNLDTSYQEINTLNQHFISRNISLMGQL